MGASSCIPSIKSVFVDLSYPDDPTQSAARDLPLSLDSAISTTLLVGYPHPAEVGRCLEELASGHPETPTALWRYGSCMAAGGTRLACLPRLPWIKPAGGARPASPFTLQFPCNAPSTEQDRLSLALALDDAAVAVVSYELAALGPSANHEAPRPEVAQALRTVLLHAARVLEADPAAAHDTHLPALSLSGGAANGAFVAGFMYALLSIREQARAFANPQQRALVDRERFGAVFGSSVGSLIGLPLDLYFTESAAPPTLGPALDACMRKGSGKVAARNDRPLQDCGLALLEHNFVANEWELLCARPGTALELLKPDAKSLLRFDPLERDQIDPFLREFRALARGNAFLRATMSAELGQGVLVGLDERACRLAGMNADACDREAVLASVSEPILAPSRPRVFSGLRGSQGEAGLWLDGGLQSVNPAARAVGYTDGKVLALNTFRALGTPVSDLKGLTPLALGTVITIGTRLIGWETSYAGLEQHRRRAHACELGRMVSNTSLCPAGLETAVGPWAAAPSLMSVSVPDDIAPAALFATGYTFDPIVMRGLFLWGERTMLRSRNEVLGFLEWCVPAALERSGVACPGGEGTSSAYAAAVQSFETRVNTEIEGYRKYEVPGAWKKHLQERKALVSHRLTTCKG